MAGGDSSDVQIVLQFSTETRCPPVTEHRRKSQETEQHVEAFDD